MWQTSTVIQPLDSNANARAKTLADRLGLPLINSNNKPANTSLRLLVSTNNLQLQLHDMQPLSADFTDKKLRHRLLTTTRKQEPLARALQLKTDQSILDATAGLGRDGILLAAMGANVTLCERHPLLYCLLEDALQNMARDPALEAIAARCQLIHQDSSDSNWLHKTLTSMDAIYCDPMFPERQSSAKVKKLAQILHQLAGDDQDQSHQAEQLLAAAQQHACRRLVIKRPRIANRLTIAEPEHQIVGRSTRFDIYYPSK